MPMAHEAGIDVQPLTPDRFTDLAALFEEGGIPNGAGAPISGFADATGRTRRLTAIAPS